MNYFGAKRQFQIVLGQIPHQGVEMVLMSVCNLAAFCLEYRIGALIGKGAVLLNKHGLVVELIFKCGEFL